MCSASVVPGDGLVSSPSPPGVVTFCEIFVGVLHTLSERIRCVVGTNLSTDATVAGASISRVAPCTASLAPSLDPAVAVAMRQLVWIFVEFVIGHPN